MSLHSYIYNQMANERLPMSIDKNGTITVDLPTDRPAQDAIAMAIKQSFERQDELDETFTALSEAIDKRKEQRRASDRQLKERLRNSAIEHAFLVGVAFIVGGFFGYYIGVEQTAKAALEMLGR